MSAGPRPRATAILLAAGRSERMSGHDKTLAPLAGLPVAAHSLRAFAACTGIDRIILIGHPGNLDALRALAAEHGGGRVAAVALGGMRRRDSVAAGLARAGDAVLVAVHDAARPLVTPAIIETGLHLAAQHGAAVAAARVADTIKRTDADGRVLETLDRTALWAAQTPQIFQRPLLERAHAATGADVTDDAMLVEALGAPVVCYASGAPNFKLTTPEDLFLADAVLRARVPLAP